MSNRRSSITIPSVIDEQIKAYMELTGIKTWNTALWELVRAGLRAKVKEVKK